MIKYLGSKRTLLPAILEVFASLEGATRVLDLFSGTARVGHAAKRGGYQVISNDHNAYAHTLATCYVEADREAIEVDALRLIEEFNALPGRPGYVTKTFCEDARFFQPKNGERIDAIREEIARKSLPRDLEAVLLVALMEAADRVDSTTGLQMAYLKQWETRSNREPTHRLPDVLPRAAHGSGEALGLDALEAAASREVDIAYLDPPYNHHSYLANYHIWESLVRWDKPEAFGIAQKRIDVRSRPSRFNRKRECREALAAVVAAVRARFLVVSFSDEGFLTRAEIEAILATRGEVSVIEHDFARYVGARIGIFNRQGEKVGAVGKLRNTEYLFVVRIADAPGKSSRRRKKP